MTAGTTVLTQGSTEDRRLYVVRQGKVKIVREDAGTQYILGIVQQGELFGESSALSPTAQPSSAIAETDAVLLVIPIETLRFVIDRKPQVKEILEERIKGADREMERQKQLAERRGGRALLDITEHAGLGEKIVPRFTLVEQAEESDCGAACLAMICKHHGVGMTLGKLREMANVTTEGATLDSLARVGESLGFTTRGMKCTYESLLGFELLTSASPAFADVQRGNLRLLLAGPTSSAGRPMPDGAKPGPGGWNRIHFIVDDLDAEVARLHEEGATFRNEVIQGPGGKQILLQDPSGNVVELFQPASR